MRAAARVPFAGTGNGPFSADDGNAIVEFCFLAVLIMIPLAYAMLGVFTVQNAAYALSSATREGGRAVASSNGRDDAAARAYTAAEIAMRDHGLRLAPGELRVTCSAQPCATPGASVTITIVRAVPLPYLPRLLGRRAASVSVRATHLELVDRFRQVG